MSSNTSSSSVTTSLSVVCSQRSYIVLLVVLVITARQLSMMEVGKEFASRVNVFFKEMLCLASVPLMTRARACSASSSEQACRISLIFSSSCVEPAAHPQTVNKVCCQVHGRRSIADFVFIPTSRVAQARGVYDLNGDALALLRCVRENVGDAHRRL